MSGNAIELQEYTKKSRIISMTLEGKHPNEIAKEVGMSEGNVRVIIKKALDEAKLHFINDSESLLVKDYVRAENLIEALTQLALQRDDKGNLVGADLKAIDRIDKLMNTKIRMMTLNVGKIKDKEDDEPLDQIFSTGSPLYQRAIEMAEQNQDFEFNDGQILFDAIQEKLEEKGLLETLSLPEEIESELDI